MAPQRSKMLGYVAVASSIVAVQVLGPAAFLQYLLPPGVLLHIFYRSWIYPFYLSPLRHIPTIPGCPLWGHFFEVITSECGVPARRWHTEHGGIVRYFFPFGAERLSIADDDAIKHMTVRNPYNYPKPLRAKAWMAPVLGEGILLAEGSIHVQQRKALAPAFSIASIRSLLPIFWAKALRMARLWELEIQREADNTTRIEILEWLNRATLDIIGEAGLGTEIDSLGVADTPLREAYRRCFNFDLTARIINGLAAFTQLVRLLPMKTNRDIVFARNTILARATAIIEQKQLQVAHSSEMPGLGKDIIGLIARENVKAAAGDSLTLEAMRDQAMTFLGAGHDTTATSVAWTLMLLAKHPAVQRRLRDEIQQFMPFFSNKEIWDESEQAVKVDVDMLPYLERVCKESLRYIPSIPMTVRQSRADDILGGYHIPAGTVIYLMANCINRLQSFWGPTADKFDPDRWQNLPSTYTPNAFMTFLHGPRGCIGRKFAEVEMKTLLCVLLSKFTFEMDPSVLDPEDLKMWRLVLRPRDGISLKISRV